jgi:hypothetical protein
VKGGIKITGIGKKRKKMVVLRKSLFTIVTVEKRGKP